MLHDGSYDFSFSGLKTSVLYFLRKNPRSRTGDVCASFQEAVVDVLVGKTVRAAADLRVKTVSASGGVSINRRFREKLGAECAQRGLQLLLAPAALCADNAAMIAGLAYYQLSRSGPSDFSMEIAPSMGLGAGGFSCQHS
jgi:N6-L-threonylcarbamoyladenine synthase